jgi:hypothetical protein
VTNNNGVWIGWLDLLTPSCTIIRNHKNYSAVAIYRLHKSLRYAKSSHSSLVVSWQRIYNSLTVTTVHTKLFLHVLTFNWQRNWNELRLNCQFRVKVTLRLTVSQSVSLGVRPNLGIMTRYLLLFDSYGLVLVGRPLWREDGSVCCIYCSCKCSLSRVRVPWDSRSYFTVSDLRLPFSSPPTTRRVTMEVFDPASTRV